MNRDDPRDKQSAAAGHWGRLEQWSAQVPPAKARRISIISGVFILGSVGAIYAVYTYREQFPPTHPYGLLTLTFLAALNLWPPSRDREGRPRPLTSLSLLVASTLGCLAAIFWIFIRIVLDL